MVLVGACDNCGGMMFTRKGSLATKVKYGMIDGRMIPIDYVKIHAVCPDYGRQVEEEEKE